jgi:MinD superfamily P-loop ATPase
MIAKEQNAEMILVDGPPGIGCPVISSLSGADFVVVVTEPTESGFSDLRRIIELTNGFGLKAGLIVNKADLNEDVTARIEEQAEKDGIHLLGRVPYDEVLVRTMAQGRTADESIASPAIRAMSEAYRNIRRLLAES